MAIPNRFTCIHTNAHTLPSITVSSCSLLPSLWSLKLTMTLLCKCTRFLVCLLHHQFTILLQHTFLRCSWITILHILSTSITLPHNLITYHNKSWVIILLIAHFMKCSNWRTQNYILLCNKLIIFILGITCQLLYWFPIFFFYCHVLLLHNLLCFFVDAVVLLP